jgi:hypothetical protein
MRSRAVRRSAIGCESVVACLSIVAYKCVLLRHGRRTGGRQVAADGDAPAQAYITAIPGWKRDVGRQLDALITQAVPGVCKAVRWNSPFYGVEGKGWFLGMHCVTKYVKVAFFDGALLRPLPPVASAQPKVRYFHVHEGDTINERQFTAWVKQASKLPGWGG